MLPSDSKHPHYRFSCHGVEFAIALIDYNAVTFPGIVTPHLMRRNGLNDWSLIDSYDTVWNNVKEEIDPEFLAQLIVDDFNKTIETYGGDMTYEQELAQILKNDYHVVNNKLVKK